MSGQATEFSVLDFIKIILPDGTNGNGSWNAVCQWPPDLFAAMAAVAERSGLYSESTFTSYWIGSRFLPSKKWIDLTRETGHKWAKTGKPPKHVQDSWRHLVTCIRFARIDDEDAEAEAWKKLVFELLAIADEACAGIGFSYPPESRQPRSGEATAGEPQTTLIQFLVYSDYHVWRERWEMDQSAIGGDVLPNLPHSLCIWVRPEIFCVQPKTSTPTVGYTLRSLTHHLALLPSIANVTTHWHIADELGGEPEPHAFNLLLVPFPYSIPGKSFNPVVGKFPGNTKDKVFRLDPRAWMRDTTPEQFAKFLNELIDAAKPEMEPVNAIVLPETALPLNFAKAVAEILARDRRLDLFVTGVVTDQEADARNSAAIYRFVNGLIMDRSFQSKHHRWSLDDDQVRRYQLGHVLDPHFKWWEQIDVSHRECHVMLFRSNATLSVLICEDLARYDPVLTVMNSIGPNLVIALLMDGPQLEQRWPGRYATVLADDPGSAVLTLTSLGMVRRSSMPADPESREIALWKEPTGKARSLRLPKGDHALLLTLTSRLVEQFTLDGRSDGGATVNFALGAAHPVRHPDPLPDWLGRIP
ncbi:hypothetical protein OZ411_06740 [Bradyrhizobium sp. Arg237L]|uniref:hypothetical protein n=1 Tax=Bradyrhizobium sp. Arg237L TaxID=3003352 RepID=UPI00249E342C|nr:hypothetical protein [Bradyrhizobium sp. Arg237L]MDI4232506.1 hypothetical protein [Bradyrhizobium sp. Arg237L]